MRVNGLTAGLRTLQECFSAQFVARLWCQRADRGHRRSRGAHCLLLFDALLISMRHSHSRPRLAPGLQDAALLSLFTSSGESLSLDACCRDGRRWRGVNLTSAFCLRNCRTRRSDKEFHRSANLKTLH
jgi:hypothetical protein